MRLKSEISLILKVLKTLKGRQKNVEVDEAEAGNKVPYFTGNRNCRKDKSETLDPLISWKLERNEHDSNC